MLSTIAEQARTAFAQGDIASLIALGEDARRDNFKAPESIKIFNMLGELNRKAGRIDEAIAAYSVSHEPPKRSDTAGLYGLAECYAALKDTSRFEAAVTSLIGSGKLDANLTSRLLIAAASLPAETSYEQLAALEFADLDDNGWYWVRRASAAFHLGREEQKSAFAAKAREAAKGNAEILLAISEIDYDANKYWDQRYNSRQGKHAPVPPAWRDDDLYIERTAREVAHLREVFTGAFGTATRFARAVDCGCGSGRMTPFLKERAVTIDCYDISETALAFAREATAQYSGLTFNLGNLGEHPLPAAHYDLVFDFTVVQHQADEQIWKRVLANYAQAARPQGFVFLVEQRGNDGPNRFPHVRNASALAYRRELEAGGCEIVLDELTPWGEICMIGRKA